MGKAPLWIARRDGQDWRDEQVLAAIRWLTEPVDGPAWQKRIERVGATFEAARTSWRDGVRIPLFDPRDLIAWYVFQANAYAADRRDWYEPDAYRLATPFKRLGQLIPQLEDVDGARDRAARLMTEGRRQPDDGIYELLVAGAYRRHGWDKVEFVPERRGGGRTHDLNASAGRRRWAIECKRVGRSGYAAEERGHGIRLAAPVHELCRARGASLVMEVSFKAELSTVPEDHLAAAAGRFLDGRGPIRNSDELVDIQVRAADWQTLRRVLAHDDIYFGSSRMIELAAGHYADGADHDMQGEWTPSDDRPFHAHDVQRLCLVSWISGSPEAARRKAKHFRKMVADASDQLPGDRPGVVHVGYELVGGNGADGLRDFRNRVELATFDPGASRLRWVYGNYMVPVHTTARDESAALVETTATYQVGDHRTADPLPMHLLFSDEGALPGPYWLGVGSGPP